MTRDEILSRAEKHGPMIAGWIFSASGLEKFWREAFEAGRKAERENCAALTEHLGQECAAQREWVELTDDEARALVNRATFGERTNWQAFVYMVDAKLKEKNDVLRSV